MEEEVDMVVEVDEEERRRKLAITKLQHVIWGQLNSGLPTLTLFGVTLCSQCLFHAT